MKNEIIKVAKDLEEGAISPERARSLLLGLFGISAGLQPMTVQHVDKMMREMSKETWLAAGGGRSNWAVWWAERNKLNINSGEGIQ